MPITKVQQAGYNNNVFFKNVPYYTQFSPKSIANCVLWLDGADPAGNGVVPSAGNLTTWVDKSDSAINAIAGTSVYPQYTTAFLNGLGVVGLTSASDYFTVANNLNTSSLTYVFLMKPTAANTANTCGILSTDTAAQYGRSIALNNMVFQIEYYSGFTATSVTTNSSTWYIVSVVFNGTSSITLSYNGTISTYAGSGTGTNSSGLTIGSYNSTNSYVSFNANFYLAEAIVYTSALSQTQFQNVESYLAQKWGLATSLAAGHLNAKFPAGSPTIIQNYVPSTITKANPIYYPVGAPSVNTPTLSGSTLTITWNLPSSGVNWAGQTITAGINGYIVTILGNGSVVATQTLGAVLTTTYAVLTSGVAYSFYISAFNSAGTSSTSSTSSTVTYYTAPNAPTALVATSSSGTLNMSWTAPAAGGPVSTYTVYVYNSTGPTLVATQTGISGLSSTYAMTSGNTYYFTVASVGAGGTSSTATPSSSVTYSVTPLTNLTGVNFYTGTTATNWTTNWQPYLSAVFSCNAVSNITTTYSKITISNFVSGDYFLGVTCWDGNIYYAPYNGTRGILAFNPTTGVQGFVGGQVSYTGSAKWYTGCLGADSNVYFFGGSSASILKYNPATATASLITIAGTGGTFAANSYRGGILGPNGRIYLSPYAATSIFWFDPASVTSGNITTNSSSSLRYEGCSLGPDGKIYMSPFSGVNTMLILDTTAGTVTYPAAGTTTAQTYRGGASLSPNGNLYFPPSVANLGVLYYNTSSGGNIIANTSALVYRDSHLGPDGKVYITANNGGSNVIVVNPTDNSLTNSNNALALNLQGANMGLDGNIYGTGYTAGFFLKIQFNNVAYPFDSNYILSPYVNHC